MRKLIIELKDKKNNEWTEMFALLDYIRDMELTYVCHDSIDGMHQFGDMVIDCNCLHQNRKKLVRFAWKRLKRLYVGGNEVFLKFWFRDYLSLYHKNKLGLTIYSNIYNELK